MSGMKEHWRWWLLLVAAGTALALWLLRPGDDAWERLQRGGALRVAIDPSFPPFENVDAQGQLVGLDVDLARMIGDELGVPLAFQSIAFDGLVDAVIADKADIVISAFPMDPRLTQDVHFSPPYFEAGLVWVTGDDSTIASADEFINYRVAVEWGSEGDAWARAHGLQIERYDTPSAALQAVATGAAEIALVDAVTAAMQAPPHILVHSPPLVAEPYVIVVSLQSPRLADAIDELVITMQENGRWEALVQPYFNILPPRPLIEAK